MCGVRNQRGRLCGRIGVCPFHAKREKQGEGDAKQLSSATRIQKRPRAGQKEGERRLAMPPTKSRFKRSWTPDEHKRFLRAMQRHGKGKWKEIAAEVKSRTANQCQSHAQKYFLRQAKSDQQRKKKSIHDITEEDVRRELDAQEEKKRANHILQTPPTVVKQMPVTVSTNNNTVPITATSPIAPWTAPPSAVDANGRRIVFPMNSLGLQYAAIVPGVVNPNTVASIMPNIPPEEKIRITINVNGRKGASKVMVRPAAWTQFLAMAEAKLEMQGAGFTRVFTRSGAEITELDEICNDDALWLSTGDDFLTPT